MKDLEFYRVALVAMIECMEEEIQRKKSFVEMFREAEKKGEINLAPPVQPEKINEKNENLCNTLLSTGEAAKLLNISRSILTHDCGKGKIYSAFMINNQWFIRKDSIEDLKKIYGEFGFNPVKKLFTTEELSSKLKDLCCISDVSSTGIISYDTLLKRIERKRKCPKFFRIGGKVIMDKVDVLKWYEKC